MEPLTHALTSLAIARAARKRLPRFGALMLVTAGIAPDLDYVSYLGGAGAFLRLHRTALHSLLGGAVVVFAVAFAFRALDRKYPQANPQKTGLGPVGWKAALAVCAAGVIGHLLLDLVTGVGVQLLWPFHRRWFGTELGTNLDPWILVLLIAGLLLPELFGLISEEIGERKKKGTPRGATAAAITLILVGGYFGARAYLRGEAVNLLLSREYHRREPLSAHAYPISDTPFLWHGVAQTDNTFEEIDVPAGSGDFDPNYSMSQYKPDDTPALRAGRALPATALFLKYARDPVATIGTHEDGYRFEVHDLRFAADDLGPDNVFLRVDMDSLFRITRQQFLFASSPDN